MALALPFRVMQIDDRDPIMPDLAGLAANSAARGVLRPTRRRPR